MSMVTYTMAGLIWGHVRFEADIITNLISSAKQLQQHWSAYSANQPSKTTNVETDSPKRL